jgi:hypothetical protein
MEAHEDARRIAEAAMRDLDLTKPSSQIAYWSLTLCVMDAVYSIGARYEGVRRVVGRYCTRYGLKKHRDPGGSLPPRCEQDGASDLLQRMRSLGTAEFARDVFQHRGRTSAKHGITKAEAVQRFAEALADRGVEHLQDVPRALRDLSLERAIRRIPGQRSGISLKYFFMLAGCEDLIKPDRMVQRYLGHVLCRRIQLAECQPLLSASVEALRVRFPHLTPRLLDGAVWQYERERKVGSPADSSGSSRCQVKRGNHRCFWDTVQTLRRDGRIPKQWRVADIRRFLTPGFSENSIRSIPPNASMTRDAREKGDYVKKGMPAEAYRIARGLFELVDDPGDG